MGGNPGKRSGAELFTGRTSQVRNLSRGVKRRGQGGDLAWMQVQRTNFACEIITITWGRGSVEYESSTNCHRCRRIKLNKYTYNIACYMFNVQQAVCVLLESHFHTLFTQNDSLCYNVLYFI